MSIHPSLKASNTMKRHRSVLSRLERVQVLQDKGKLELLTGSVLGMPKVRHLKMKVRKEKAAATTDAAGTAAKPGAAAPAGNAAKAPAGAAKPAAAEAKSKK